MKIKWMMALVACFGLVGSIGAAIAAENDALAAVGVVGPASRPVDNKAPVPKVTFDGTAIAPEGPLTLWYRRPAGRWIDALAIGSGRLGGMVFGGVARERVGLNEDSLWSGGPFQPAADATPEQLAEIRRLMFAGEQKAAQNLADKVLQGKPRKQASYQTVGELQIDFPGQTTATNYRRQLDLTTAVTTVAYTDADGVTHTRETFASPIDQVIVMRLTADRPGRISFDATFMSPLVVSVETVGSNGLKMTGRNGDLVGGQNAVLVAGALTFQSRLRVMADGGTTAANGDRVTVTGANAVTLLVAAATSYKRYDDVTGDPDALCAAYVAKAAGQSFDALRQAHVAEHGRLFDRVSLDLGTNAAAAAMPTDERVRNFAKQSDPSLVATYFQFGRYLLISGSRPGTQAMGLQGIWNDQLKAPWDGKYTININTEMNYWPVGPTNLPECEEPLFRLVSELAETGSVTARRTYNARGWVAHHNTDLWRATAPIDGAFWGQWPMGGAWLCNELYQRYLFELDRDYLQTLYPIMKGSAEFFLDFLVEHPKYGWLVTVPSNSPENEYKKGQTNAAGPTMDMQILRELFGYCVQASEVLGVDEDFRTRCADARKRLAPNQVGKGGQLQEWLEDIDLEAIDIPHRHMSPLYGLFPGNEITPADPKIFAAARKLTEMRAYLRPLGMGWATAWRVNLWARLRDPEKAYAFLENLISTKTETNLFDRPSVQLDGNFGGTSGITEMLLQSHAGEVHLLPALPAQWSTGRVRGLRARGGVVVDIEWTEGRLTQVALRSPRGSSVTVRYGETTKKVDVAAGQFVRLNGLLQPQ